MHALAAASSEVAPGGAQLGVLRRGPTSYPLISHHAGPEAWPSVLLLSMPWLHAQSPAPVGRALFGGWVVLSLRSGEAE